MKKPVLVLIVLAVAAFVLPGRAASGAEAPRPDARQLRAITALEAEIGAPVIVRYNPLTATPNHVLSYASYLSPPSRRSPDAIARGFLAAHRAIFRFTQEDLSNLALRTRAVLPDIGTTILVFQQQSSGVPVYHGQVGVNVNADGRIIDVGDNSYPDLRVLGAFRIHHAGRRVIFPLGATGRRAYLVDARTHRTIVDASTGRVLRRVALTVNLGPHGGGVGRGRLATFRPDVQDLVESYNQAGTAQGKVFDGAPTTLSGWQGFGRPSAGYPPRYGAESTASGSPGRGFRFSLVWGRNSAPLAYRAPYAQVLRGLPDALHPTRSSPLGWFYLPTASGGKEIADSTPSSGTSRGYGYDMSADAQARNQGANAPSGDGDQPFSVTRTRLPHAMKTQDARTLSIVLQSRYAEGNNATVADDRANDGGTTMGIRAYAPDRHFTAKRFDFRDGYELGGTDAGGTPFFPPGADADLLPAAMSLFYYANLIHDYLYGIGFTEALWNFQQDNFGRGGAGGDGVRVNLQSGGGLDNASFGPTVEGQTPEMNVFLNTDASTRRSDNAFEFDTIAHEFYHGVSTRSVGKGDIDCVGNGLGGESGGLGEGWSDYNAASLSDDDGMFEYTGGEFETSFRRLPLGNYRWSYGAANGIAASRRDGASPDIGPRVPPFPFEVHDVGEIWVSTLWDMRELMIVRQPGGVFFDGSRRLGAGARYYVGDRALRSVDGAHPIDYRSTFNTQDLATIKGAKHIVRPGLIAKEMARRGNRRGPIATAVSTAGRLSDTLVLRGMQLSPCNPSFVQSRDSILLADRELTGGENAAVIWRAFASHGIGTGADSTTRVGNNADIAPVVVESDAVPSTVTQCERLGAPHAPGFSVKRTGSTNRVTIKRTAGAARYIVSRSTRADGAYRTVATLKPSKLSYTDATGGRRYFYRVRAVRNADCVSTAKTVPAVG